MNRSRLFKLADWLDRQAIRESETAAALAKIENADPIPCGIRARLMHEIADFLREEACNQQERPSEKTMAPEYADRRGRVSGP